MKGNSNFSFSQFSDEIQKIVAENLNFKILGSSQGSVFPEQYLGKLSVKELRFNLKYLNVSDLQLLSIVAWFLDPIPQRLLIEEIRERLDYFGDSLPKDKVCPLLNDQRSSLEFFYYFIDIHKDEWFGNKAKRLKHLLNHMRIKVIQNDSKRKIRKYTGYCRGYRSSRPAKKIESQVLENNRLYQLQIIVEEAKEEITYIDNLLFIAGFNDNYQEINRLLYEKQRQLIVLKDYESTIKQLLE